MRVFIRVNTKTSRDKMKANQMDLNKTRCKQTNVNRIAEYSTRQIDKYTGQKRGKTEPKVYQCKSVSDKEW